MYGRHITSGVRRRIRLSGKPHGRNSTSTDSLSNFAPRKQEKRVADILTADEGISAPEMGGNSLGQANAFAERVARRSGYEATTTALAKSLVKGVGHVTNNGVPLNEGTH